MFESDDDDDFGHMQDPDPGPGPEAEVQARSPIRPPHITSKAPLPASLFDDSQEEDEEEFLMSACQDEMELIQRHNPTASKEPAKPGSPDENDLGCRSPSPPSPLEQRSESRKRRFPGPAGILPRISTSSLNKIPKIPDPGSESVLPRRPPVKEPSCSQNEIDRATFNSSVWQRMLEDHSIENENDPSAPTQKFNISWVKRKTGLGLSKKTPVLMCAIKSLDLCSVDPSCVLHDRSGDVKATIHRDVMEEYGPYMLPGTVLVLKNIPVIMTVRHHYMALTVNNLVAMYKPKGLHQTGIWAKEVCKLTKEDIEKVSKQLEIEEKRLAAEMIRAQKLKGANNSPMSCGLNSPINLATRPSFPSIRAVPRSFNPNHESTPMVRAPLRPPHQGSISASSDVASSSSALPLAVSSPLPGSFAPRRPQTMQRPAVESQKPFVFKPKPLPTVTIEEDFDGLDEDSMFGDF